MADKKTSPAGGSQTTQGSGMPKLTGVRRALETLGKDAKPAEIQDFMKRRFNLDITRGLITKYKSSILANPSGRAKTTTKTRPMAARSMAKTVSQPQARLVPMKANNGRGIQLEDIQVVKSLVKRVGPEHLRSLIDLLARE
jgi:hypothetical protein